MTYPVKKKMTITDMMASPMNFSRSLQTKTEHEFHGMLSLEINESPIYLLLDVYKGVLIFNNFLIHTILNCNRFRMARVEVSQCGCGE